MASLGRDAGCCLAHPYRMAGPSLVVLLSPAAADRMPAFQRVGGQHESGRHWVGGSG